MVDIPGNSTTTATISVGGTVNNTLEVAGDHDWFKITLTAGQSISVSLDGITLEDSYLRIYDANGNLLYENDDIISGVERDSLLAFTANYTGTYYIDVGAFDEAYAGTYQLSVSPYTPPPLGTVDELAEQLTHGYWGGDEHHFNVTQGGTITVNLTALTNAGENLARTALATWADIIGVTFVEVTSGGQIVFDDNESGAFSDGIWSNGIISSAHVNVSTQWLASYGTGLNSYSFQTYIHEIGHALGLGHQGNYNGNARYPYDAEFQNDSWAMSVMSYFSQTDNTYFAGLGFDENFILTPMTADIVAMAELYGLSTTTRTGDTVYGFNSTAGRDWYNAALNPSVSYTVFDNGGTDTLDYSGFNQGQRIDLNPETFSNIGGDVGNVTIARGTIIENAIGGSGADTIIGNNANNQLEGRNGNDTLSGGTGDDTLTGGAGNDQLNGGVGSDTFRDTAANLNGDTIIDFAAGDRIVISNASLAGFTFSLSGSTLTYSGGSLTLTGLTGQLQASTAAGGGVQLTVGGTSAADARNDFNGDGRSDVLWRDDNGVLTNWLGQPNGSFVSNHAAALFAVNQSLHVVGTGDFNGDGRDDVLWRDDAGVLTNWLGQPNGSFVSNHAVALYGVNSSLDVVGTGDFNGDGRDDVLWRDDAGMLTDWLGQANGSFVSNHAVALYAAGLNMHVVGTGDFNGDGRSDILWRDDAGVLTNWLGQPNGSFVSNHAVALYAVDQSLNVVGTGDFNGDGRDDILWRDDAGILTDWLGQANGGFVSNHAVALYAVDPNLHVAGIGDFNGDGRDDVLWRDDAGILTDWLGQANGSFVSNHGAALYAVDQSLHVQAPDIFLM